MGTEVVVALALAAAAAGATAYNTNQTAKKQDKQLAMQLRSSRDKQRDADAKTQELIAKQAKSTDADERQSSLSQFTTAIQNKRGNAVAPLNTVGAVSDAYRKSGSDAALGMTDSASKIAGLISSIDAPSQQRQNDKYDIGRYATDIDQIKRFSAGDDFLAQMQLRNIRRNPWIDAAASVAGGAASAYSGGGASSDGGWNFYGGAGENGMGTQVGADAYNGFGTYPGYQRPRTWQQGG